MRKREDIRDGGGGDGEKKGGWRDERKDRGSERKRKEGRGREKRPKACVLTAPVDALACRRACEHYSRVGARSLRRIII